jgi:hypothetical protein
MPQSYRFFFAYNFPWEGIRLLVTPLQSRANPKQKEVKPMTLARCRKCGKIASTVAKTCPHCEVRNPTKKPAGPLFRLMAAFVGVALVVVAVESSGLRSSLAEAKIELPRIPLPTNSSSESPGKKREKHRFNVTAALATTIKKSTDNPNSLVWERIMSDDDAGVVCFEYRVKNSHGEYNQEFLTYIDGKASEAPEDWNRYCAGKKLNNMIRVRDAV